VSERTEIPMERSGDVVLPEVRCAKETLSVQYGHDLDKLFEKTREREKLSGHTLVELPVRRRDG
jgi:hypothetical protein